MRIVLQSARAKTDGGHSRLLPLRSKRAPGPIRVPARAQSPSPGGDLRLISSENVAATLADPKDPAWRDLHLGVLVHDFLTIHADPTAVDEPTQLRAAHAFGREIAEVQQAGRGWEGGV